ncbi:LysE family transporter [Candidatus Pelagibacter sp.]|nr:LysE family transporter [Candidatus Pelagibacter sp.]
MEYLLLGFFTGLSLILAIGAQNIFVIEQGLKKKHIFLVCFICSISDLILIFLGIFLFLNLYNIFILEGSSEIDFTIFFALGSGILISFNSTSLKLIQTFAKIGKRIIAKTKSTAGKVNMYAVFFSVFAKVSFIKKADN